MANPQLIIVNQFGEESINQVTGGDYNGAAPIATNTILANLTGDTALPIAKTTQQVSDALPAKTGVASIPALATPVAAVTITLSTTDTYSDAAVKTAVDTALASVVADLQTQLTKMNAILAALKVTA